MDKRANNKGTKGNKGGRPSKAEEVKMIERLSPLEPKAYAALRKRMLKKEILNMCKCSTTIMLVSQKKQKTFQ